MSTASTASAPKGHPLGLYILFATEMWERFNYYGMRALLVLYMTDVFLWAPSKAGETYKWYTSLVYLTPLLGGLLADRFIGQRVSIIIGGITMAAGSFALSLPSLAAFYIGLGLLVIGNGFFKPNISTVVGKMYRDGDPRRDGAFTIFYMGINLGALIAPILCSRVKEAYGARFGFLAASVGMILGLIVFLLGQKRVIADVEAAGNSMSSPKNDSQETSNRASGAASGAADDEAAQSDAATGLPALLRTAWTYAMLAAAIGIPLYEVYLVAKGEISLLNAIMPSAFAVIGGWMGITLLSIKKASRDMSTVIFILFAFAVLFWMAFEQAGSSLNLWAQYNTNRTLVGSFSLTAEDLQAANPIFIIALAPVFSWLWSYLGRRGLNPPAPIKMTAALFLLAASFGAMVLAAVAENSTVTSVPLAAVPAEIKDISKLNAGRLRFDTTKKELETRGVLAPFSVAEAVQDTVPKGYIDDLVALDKQGKDATKNAPVTYVLTSPPASLTVPLGDDGKPVDTLAIGADGRTITLTKALDEGTKNKLLIQGGDPKWREALQALADKSKAARVSVWWLILSYLLATVGELCLSPVGLSMVTKLAPARFASLFMGVWLLASSAAQYVGGSMAESWGKVAPQPYFMMFVVTSGVGGILLLVLAVPIRRLMHKVT